MKRATPFLLPFALGALAFIPAARAHASIQARPEGIPLFAWVPITDNLGFVSEHRVLQPQHEQTPAILGYLVARRDGHWLRLNAIAHGKLFRDPSTSRRSGTPWMRVAKNLAFVSERRISERTHGQVPSVLGYFMVARRGHWVRMDLIPQGALFRGPLTVLPAGRRSWIPLIKNLRFVVESPTPERSNENMPSVFGYFVARHGGHWWQLDSISHGTSFDRTLKSNE